MEPLAYREDEDGLLFRFLGALAFLLFRLGGAKRRFGRIHDSLRRGRGFFHDDDPRDFSKKEWILALENESYNGKTMAAEGDDPLPVALSWIPCLHTLTNAAFP